MLMLMLMFAYVYVYVYVYVSVVLSASANSLHRISLHVVRKSPKLPIEWDKIAQMKFDLWSE